MFGRKRKGDSGLDKIRETTDLAVDVENLVVKYVTSEDTVEAVNSIDLKLKRKRTLGLVGETGAGKTTAMLALMNMVPSPPGVITEGSIKVNGLDMRKLTPAQLQAVRGSEIAMIFQDPMTSLNPVYPVGRQVAEVLRLHRRLDRWAAKARTVELFQQVGIPDPAARYDAYPRQLSGGLRQRVMIAMAMACEPELLIADEPTTALDVTIQAQILRLMGDLRRDHGTAILLITHNMGVVAQLCDYVYVMYAGQIVEAAETFALFRAPRHPYTQGLLKAIPSLEGTADRLYTIRGSVPDPRCPLPGCRFCPRCDQSRQDCARQVPDLRALAAGHWVRCCHIS